MTSQTQTELWKMHDEAIAQAKQEGRIYSGRYSRQQMGVA